MSNALHELLSKYREAAGTERDKGSYFEALALAWLKNDPLQQQNYSDAWTYKDWAAQQGLPGNDKGIDLVAKLKDEDGFCAVQCKFFDEDAKITLKDLGTFFTASGKKHFKRRLIIDTTKADWTENAREALDDQSIETNRIGFSDLAQAPFDWGQFAKDGTIRLERKELRPHQVEALEAVRTGLAEADRGKLLMACGTGKTFTSLKIAENLVGRGGAVLYMVPSLALMSQTVREWANDKEIPLKLIAVCSDTKVGKRKAGDDVTDLEIHDLAFPATTDARKIGEKLALMPDEDAALAGRNEMLVVFATYQSIQVVAEAQRDYGLREFDLIICDEAHRTTGAIFDGDESSFVKVHDADFIKGKKRLYMTATPRIFGDGVKERASDASVELCSMDDVSLYGETLFERGFGWAVQKGLLTDYKVIVLAVDEAMVSTSVQKRLTDEDNKLTLDDATKMVGCFKALTKADIRQDTAHDHPGPMHRALAFCKNIETSKLIADEFPLVAAEYVQSDAVAESPNRDKYNLECEADHVDGTFDAKQRNECLDWLKEDAGENTCRILSNARCLSEGVDVPALDAILFMHPRKSMVDIVQAVGRVMRRAEGKRMGYVILPVAIPAGVKPEDALNDNERYKVIWQILNALRAHDDRFDATINKIEFGVDVSHQIEVIPVTNELPTKTVTEKAKGNYGEGGGNDDRETVSEPASDKAVQGVLPLFDEFASAIMAKIVKKVGRRTYWEDWATDIAKIAQNHITRLEAAIAQAGSRERQAFDAFLEELRDDLNESISQSDAVEMLAQHLITKPVFDTLFEGTQFTDRNPVSKAINTVLEALQEQNLEKERQTLAKFYASVKTRAEGVNTADGKQKLIVELYDKFFRSAFPRTTEKLGIVYTPVEIVDFIIHSVNDVLQKDFGQTLGSKGVHILDPFTGTGTFITRLLQSGLIAPNELEHKYRNEIHANEIVLLAYYIAAINIEATFHGLRDKNQGIEFGEGDYIPFEGICLTDTFQMYEKDDLISHYMPDNSERRERQKAQDIRVIVGNPPYSAGQNSANDNNANVAYPYLDGRIHETYADKSTATNKNALYDSYIRAIRWGSDRLGNAGVMAYVSGGAWVERNFADGMRQCLAEEFTNLYVFHLRGDIRKNMLSKGRAGEGGNVFGSGSMTGVSISLFVKNPEAKEHGRIRFHDIGDYLSQKEKLEIIRNFASITGIEQAKGWKAITPDEHHDWLNQRDASFDAFIKIGDKKDKQSDLLFENYSSGVKTQRDAWCYNSSCQMLETNISNTIDFYNAQVASYGKAKLSVKIPDTDKFIDTDPRKISWTRALKWDLEKERKLNFDDDQVLVGTYRPFQRQWLYFSRRLNEMIYQMPRIFPNALAENRVIAVSGIGARAGFSALMMDQIPCLDTVEKGQCFPLKLYEADDGKNNDLFSGNGGDGYRVKDGITDAGLKHFQKAYPGETITKEDIFYYVYGLLHCEEYRARYKDNLSKELPRIPCVKQAKDFWAFVEAGRKLGDLHVNYESVEHWPVEYKQGDLRLANIGDPEKFFRVEKWKFGGKGKDKDKTTVIYNPNITMTNIPLEAYDYVVNGKPALEWVMERQIVKTDKASGIVNDANRYAIETMENPAYPLELFQRVITVSIETMKIVRGLPKLEID